ncbi:MAG: DUF4430 domain-containing protein [Clostridia bacterium]|nr:DUF4430 domain-containing protein [Clostridia bacterium]
MKRLRIFLALALALLMIALPMTACNDVAPEGDEITITVKVVHKDKTEKTFTIETTATTLLGALQQEKLVEGEDQTAGFFITAVDGEVADWNVDQGWWCFTKGGEMMMTGAEATTIADGDTYEITYTIGY